jgi:Sulfotransferase family
MGIQPIFLFSISRSGSTLVQRIIGAHESVATASEPWLLLPHAYTLRRQGVDAEYVHPLLVTAIEDFCDGLPGGGDDYLDELRGFVLRLYEKAAGEGAAYFLDKTPPYCLVADEIMRLFPEGKFVFLWRNPLSVVASMIETWGPWYPTFMSSDLFIGLPRLIATYEANRDRVHAARFEDLTGGNETPWRELTGYLGIEFEPETLASFAKVELGGRMGDPTGRTKYSTLSTEPQQKWKGTLANPLRREWCRRYLRFLGSERLATMGYDLDKVVAEVDCQPTSLDSFAPDLWQIAKDVAKEPIRVRTRGRRLGTPSVIRRLLEA